MPRSQSWPGAPPSQRRLPSLSRCCAAVAAPGCQRRARGCPGLATCTVPGLSCRPRSCPSAAPRPARSGGPWLDAPPSRSGARWRSGGPSHALCCTGDVSTSGQVAVPHAAEQEQHPWLLAPCTLCCTPPASPAILDSIAWRLYRKPEQSGGPSHAIGCMARQHVRLNTYRPLPPAAGERIRAGLAAPPCCMAMLTISGGLAVRNSQSSSARRLGSI